MMAVEGRAGRMDATAAPAAADHPVQVVAFVPASCRAERCAVGRWHPQPGDLTGRRCL